LSQRETDISSLAYATLFGVVVSWPRMLTSAGWGVGLAC
jgi:hypothetical protein